MNAKTVHLIVFWAFLYLALRDASLILIFSFTLFNTFFNIRTWRDEDLGVFCLI